MSKLCIMCISLLVGAGITYFIIKKRTNNVHFYVARDKYNCLCLHIGKIYRGVAIWLPKGEGFCAGCTPQQLESFGINPDNYKDLKWEDEPVEVYVNMKK